MLSPVCHARPSAVKTGRATSSPQEEEEEVEEDEVIKTRSVNT
jgi:hypothetical protein